jgi:hypothetical protein
MGDLAQRYARLLRERGSTLPHRERFYLFSDPELSDLEEEACDAEHVDEFYRAVRAVYEEWMREMGEEEWRALESYNETLPGALRNHWVGDVLTWPPSEHTPASNIAPGR